MCGQDWKLDTEIVGRVRVDYKCRGNVEPALLSRIREGGENQLCMRMHSVFGHSSSSIDSASTDKKAETESKSVIYSSHCHLQSKNLALLVNNSPDQSLSRKQ